MGSSQTAMEFGGFPFLDATFKPTQLLAATAAVRASEASDPRSFGYYVGQDWVEAQASLATDAAELTARPTHPHESALIAEATARAAEALPTWKPLLRLPVRTRIMTTGDLLSASIPSRPQLVLLGPRAFESRESLTEHLLHELGHNWLNLLERFTPTIDSTIRRRIVLPSGTASDAPYFLLGAAHVGTLLTKYYRATDQPERAEQLRSYTTQCIRKVVEIRDLLKPAGLELWKTLQQYWPNA